MKLCDAAADDDDNKGEYDDEYDDAAAAAKSVQFCVLISRVIEISRGSKGWFTCDKRCQSYKIDYDIANNEFKYQRSEEQRIIADAKSNVGIFSSFGVEEARDIFWRRFSDGKKFAKRQTMWDAMFMGK